MCTITPGDELVCFFLMIPHSAESTLFPYTTLFRSLRLRLKPDRRRPADRAIEEPVLRDVGRRVDVRSEEHTSELQSRQYLVCRLLLEKKKKTWCRRSLRSLRILLRDRHRPYHTCRE